MFSVEERAHVREHLVDAARADARIIAAAEVGSLTQTDGDRWSDLDLTFGVAAAFDADDVLADWTLRLERDDAAVQLFDLRVLDTIYRVFLFPGGLQVDLSFTGGAVARTGPKFRLLFGSDVRRYDASPHDAREVFGMCVHHALRARIGIERGNVWSAHYYLDELRREMLTLACIRRNLPTRYARGFDQLPRDVLDNAAATIAATVERADLLRALRSGIALLGDEATDLDAFARVAPTLQELTREELDAGSDESPRGG